MRTILLMLAAFVLSAQNLTVEVFRPDLPSDEFTNHKLNGLWWQRATPQERWVYIQAWQDITGRQVFHYPSGGDEVSTLPNILNGMSDPSCLSDQKSIACPQR